MRSKRLGVVALTMVGAMALAACGDDKPKDTGAQGSAAPSAAAPADVSGTLTFWDTTNEQEQKVFKTLIDEFQAKYPNVKVTYQPTAFDGARDKFKTAAQGGNAPDVMRAEIAWTPEFADLGYLKPLDGKVDTSDYLDAPLNYNKYGDQLWGIPQVTDALALLYNKELLDKAGVQPPTTLEEIKSAAAAVKDKAKVDGFYMRGDSYWLLPYFYGFGGEHALVNAGEKKITVNKAENVQALQFVADLMKAPGVAKNTDFPNDYGNAMTAFKDGKVAMILNGPWASSDILSGKAFKSPDNLGIAPIPAGPAGQGSPVGGHNYVISNTTKSEAAAIAFIEFMNSAESQAKISKANNTLPTRKSAYDQPDVTSNKVVTDFKAVIEKATNRPVIPEGGALFDALTQNFQKVLTGKADAKAALDSVATAYEGIVKGYAKS